MLIKTLAATGLAALLATSASAQMFGSEIGTDLDQERFNTSFGESGYHDAWDRDDEVGLNENELATGVFSDWDRDNDRQITEEEWGLGSGRWYGGDYGGNFGEYDADGSGFVDTTEFGGRWNNEYFGGWDADSDGLLTQEEFGGGLYSRADANQDMVITVEEEGWFEGWFDGDDVTAEIEQVGDVLN